MSGAILVYITCKDTEQAEKIAGAVVAARLAACANILPGMKSLYRWQGKIETAQECMLLLKTRSDLFDDCAALVRSLHSYETPCIVALPLVNGTPDFLDWIIAQTT